MEFDIVKFLIFVVFCFIVVVVDVIFGGGGLIFLFVYFVVGFLLYMVLGINKLLVFFFIFVSVFKFWKVKKVNVEIVLKLFVFFFVGVVLGVKIVVFIDIKYFKFILFGIFILVFFYVLKNKSLGENNYYKGIILKIIIFGKIMVFCLGFYDGFLGFGIVVFLMFCLIKIFKLDFFFVSGNIKILNFLSNFVSLVVFVFLGKLNWVYGIFIVIVMIFGVIIGLRFVILKGNKFIKLVFLVVIIVLILKMLVEIFF